MPALQTLMTRFRESTSLGAPSTPQMMLSPWAPSAAGNLHTIVWSDIFDQAPKFATRGEAIAVPAVAKGRNILVSLIAPRPLIALDTNGRLERQPAWLHTTSTGVSPQHRMAWTIDDLIFHGVSLWTLERDDDGQIVDAMRWPIDQWEIDDDGRILVTGTPAAASDVCLFTSFGEGLLTNAGRSLQGATLLEAAWVRRANDPIPVVDLHMTVEDALSDEDAKELAQTWDAARRNGATAVTPAGIEARALGQVSPDLFVQGRNASRLDLAGFFNLPAQLLDASLSTSSLTYSTQEGRSNELATISLPYWTDAIAARLSLPDMTPEGVRIRFDLTDLHTPTVNATGTPTED